MPQPTGQVTRGTDGAFELTLTRTFDAPASDVWASLTDSTRTAEWLGPWRGDAGVGKTVELRMSFEEGADWSAVRIDACDPSRVIRVTVSGAGLGEEWLLEARLAENDGQTELTFVHFLSDPAVAETSGPGWEYYLDMLVASRAGVPRPEWDDYFPAQLEYYSEQVRRATAS
ncbi:SRPBCC family protein [Mycetocola sp. 2940]|uniref:SRPBCC family protein n=1 Tax=Mycetocola sp. 2940 TaxID=3156452 RepID=UPI0033998FCC